ncbi:hypothetical protein PIB30_078836 [Stylosanthes scabra]|uniref:Secreted protein n=1 Tax=Stylosanthes scabra TaxID=79078 RepID=A0ABU6XQR9_9FABA|nr:hypothetical protein [Stylosanthes scabra]
MKSTALELAWELVIGWVRDAVPYLCCPIRNRHLRSAPLDYGGRNPHLNRSLHQHSFLVGDDAPVSNRLGCARTCGFPPFSNVCKSPTSLDSSSLVRVWRVESLRVWVCLVPE